MLPAQALESTSARRTCCAWRLLSSGLDARDFGLSAPVFYWIDLILLFSCRCAFRLYGAYLTLGA
jgi:hypothetical protein